MIDYLKSLRIARCLAICVLVGMIAPLLFGCVGAQSGAKRELWIVTEQTTWDRMNGQLYVLEQAYEAEHPDVDVCVEYLPTDEQERNVYLQKLRTEILRGGGPDCYLLPTDTTLVLDDPALYTYVQIDPLFSDVELAMRNGLFYDITELFESDDTLNKDALNAQIMRAGVVDGTRYVLPLRYDIPVLYARNDALEAAGLDPAILQEDILTVMDAVYQTGDPILAGGLLCSDPGVFSEFVDYESSSMMLDVDTLSRYLESYRALKSLLGAQYFDYDKTSGAHHADLPIGEGTVLLEPLDIKRYIYCEYGESSDGKISSAPVTEYYPLCVGSMQDLLAYLPMSQYEQIDLTVAPLRSMDGEIVATVTYYGALGAGCEDPALAYDFLRQFLLEESQWEQNRPERNHTKPLKGSGGNTSNDLQYPGLIERGWPVQDEGALPVLWQLRRLQLYIREMDSTATSEQRMRMRKIGLMGVLKDEGVHLFALSVGEVRFQSTIADELELLLQSLNDPARANAPTDVDVRAAAEQFIRDMQWHFSEG